MNASMLETPLRGGRGEGGGKGGGRGGRARSLTKEGLEIGHYYSAHLRRFHQETIKVEGKRKDGWMNEREFSHSIVATVTLGTIIVSMTLRAVG